MVPPPKPLASCRGTDLVATVKGPLSRVADSSAAVMTLSGIQFEVGDADVVVVKGILVAGTLVVKVAVDSSLIESFSIAGCLIGVTCSDVTAATCIETISAPVAAINLG